MPMPMWTLADFDRAYVTYRNLQRHHLVLPGIAWISFLFNLLTNCNSDKHSNKN